MTDRDWELGILACLVANHRYMASYADILSQKHFAYPHASKYLKIFKTVYAAHRRLPTGPEFRKILQDLHAADGESSDILKRWLKDAKTIYSMEVSGVTHDHIKEFITERVLGELAERLPSADYKKREEILEEVRKNVNTLSGLDSVGGDKLIALLTRDEIVATVEQMQDVQRSGYATTGSKVLDDLIGGFGPGEFSVFAAPTGVGKTALLIGVEVANTLQGRRTLHVSMDEPLLQIKKRFLTSFSGMSSKAFVTPGDYADRMADIIDKASQNFFVWSEPNETITTLDIIEVVKKKQEELFEYDIKNGLRPAEKAGLFDLIVTDYATKTKRWMSKKSSGEQSWDTIRYTSEEHQHLARTLDIPVVSAFQGNKGMALTEIGQLTDIGMGYSGNQALTNCLIIGRMQADLHATPTPLWLYGAKTRCEEGLFLVPILYDKVTQRWWDDPDRELDYISSTTSKKAKPVNFSKAENQAKRRAEAPPNLAENEDYAKDEDADDLALKKAVRQWRGKSKLAACEEFE